MFIYADIAFRTVKTSIDIFDNFDPIISLADLTDFSLVVDTGSSDARVD